MIAQLKASTESLYDAFSTYPGNPQMDGSPLYTYPTDGAHSQVIDTATNFALSGSMSW